MPASERSSMRRKSAPESAGLFERGADSGVADQPPAGKQAGQYAQLPSPHLVGPIEQELDFRSLTQGV